MVRESYNKINESRGHFLKTFEQPLSAKEETEYLEEMNGEDLEAAD